MGGSVAAGFERVASEFARNFSERGDTGAAFVAMVGAEVVVDLWDGVASPDGAPWRSETLAAIFSGSKGLVATCLLILLDRGLLDLTSPVARYWPEFAINSKADVTVGHVLSHTAGLAGLTTPVNLVEATDSRRMAALLASQAPLHRPGEKIIYHAITFGWICDELMRRIDGRSIGQFLAEEVAAPLGLDIWIGLPASRTSQLAVMTRADGFGAPGGRETARFDAAVGWSIWENPPRFAGNPLPCNSPFWQTAEVPASNGVASAFAMAKLYACLAQGGTLEGTTIVRPETVTLARRQLAGGIEPFLDRELAFGAGFQLQNSDGLFGPPEQAFGHPGAGGSMHGAWPQFACGFSYLPGCLQDWPGNDPRAASLLTALAQCLNNHPSALGTNKRD